MRKYVLLTACLFTTIGFAQYEMPPVGKYTYDVSTSDKFPQGSYRQTCDPKYMEVQSNYLDGRERKYAILVAECEAKNKEKIYADRMIPEISWNSLLNNCDGKLKLGNCD